MTKHLLKFFLFSSLFFLVSSRYLENDQVDQDNGNTEEAGEEKERLPESQIFFHLMLQLERDELSMTQLPKDKIDHATDTPTIYLDWPDVIGFKRVNFNILLNL
jgi:hypothetical protein